MHRSRPNIVLVTVDSLRADHLGCYGYSKPTSPNLDQFARENSLFLHTISDGPNTPHAFPAIMASQNSLMFSKLGLFDAPVTLAEVFKSAGYTTLGFNAANPYVSRSFHYDRGFDEFHDYLDFSVPTDSLTSCRQSETGINIPELDLNRYLISDEVVRSKAYLEEKINSDCFDAINSVSGEPFFLWVHFMDTHFPYLPQPSAQLALGIESISKEENFKLNTRFRENMPLSSGVLSRVVQLYDASIRQLDSKIGALFEFLKKRNLFESSMIVFTADHGEEFKDHGDLQHKSKLFDELIHVPLLIKKPHQQNSEVHEGLVSLMHLAPTLLSSVGIENVFETNGIFDSIPGASNYSHSQVFSGASYCGDNATPVDRNLLNIDVLPKIYSCREDYWKLIMDFGKDQKMLFNLIADPLETQNLYQKEKNTASRLEERLLERIVSLEKRCLKSKIAKVRRRVLSNPQEANAVRLSS